MRAGALAAIACSGCSSILGIGDFKLNDDAGNTGGEMMMADASPDAAPGCFGPAGFMVCLMPVPSMDRQFVPGVPPINTDDPGVCLPTQPPSWKAGNQPDACFIIGKTITIDLLSATGSRPLVIVAADRITVNGTIDVAAHRGASTRPPGAPFGGCVQPQPAQDSGLAGAGGAGGSFMHRGGIGGSADAGIAQPGIPAAPDTNKPTILRAGCSGGVGAPGPDGLQGIPGTGGGAIFLVAGNRLEINGTINASGSGGSPSGPSGGGGGGGAGGMILLHAAALTTSAGSQIYANGGGGAGGASGAPAMPGQDPTSATQAANGGGGVSPGGLGFAGPIQAGMGASGGPQRGGGGGGGGGGYIRSNQPIDTGGVSPSPSIEP